MEDLKQDPATTEETQDNIEDTEQEVILEEEDLDQENLDQAEQAEQEEPATKEPSAQDYLDRLQRTMAEFDNYRKRTEKEKSAMYDMGLSDTILAILPVLDNFERALEAPCKDSSYVKGMEMIYKQMIDLLDSIDVTQIDAKGEKFDMNIHNAVAHIEDDQYGENEIVEELQKGYIYKGEKVIRHSMVQVAN